jgi:FMN phosphatase YigB (HAD superfamily)
MRFVLFDLGNTLESQNVLRPGAREAVIAIAAMRDNHGERPRLGLISDFHEAATPGAIPAIVGEYRQLLQDLALESLFRPFDQAITLSTQVGVRKPDARIFRAALDKFDPAARFADAIFITEDTGHVAAARGLGMQAVHLRGPDQPTGEVQNLGDLAPHVQRLLRRGRGGPAGGG